MITTLSCEKEQKFSSSSYTLKIKNITVQVELANTEETRTNGLMYRETLEPDSGMLFAYSKAQKLTFWMKNTFIPLSIAFISNGKINEIQDMSVDDGKPDELLPRYQSHKKVKYALEMRRGWFKDHGIKIGSKVIFSPLLKKALNQH